MRILFTLFILLLASCTPLAVPSSTTNSVNLLNDGIFRIGIKTVQLYPDKNDMSDVLLPAAMPINQQGLRLEFDDLSTSYQSFTAKITHCNADWSKSLLSNLDFLTEYNSFPITQYAFSSDTHIPYIHYWFQLPSVKLSGNYVLTLYQDDATPVLSRRFMVYANSVQLSTLTDFSGASQLANKQAISLKLNYQQLDVQNASTQFEVYIRQNQRWDNMISNIPPTFIRETEKEIEYRVNDEAYMPTGGNEYRFFDLRSILNPGQNVVTVQKTSKPYTAFIAKDRSREDERYAQYLDLNGNYVIQNYDNSLQYSENYIKVNFTLAVNKPLKEKIFINGRLVDNTFSKEVEMVYDSVQKAYRKELLIKQGWYNYQYLVGGNPEIKNQLEGNHFETENLYEVMVYYKSLQPRADLLVAYYSFFKNQR